MNIPFALLSLIIAVPFMGVIFSFLSQKDEENPENNVYNVTIFTIIANIVLLFRIFMMMDVHSDKLQLLESFNWLEHPNINLYLGIDIFSGLLILAVHVALLVGLIFSRHTTAQPKVLSVFTLAFLGLFTGLLVAADIFSFCFFFEAMLLPAFMLSGIFGEIKKNGVVYRFFIYNFIGGLILLAGTMLLFAKQKGDTSLSSLHGIVIHSQTEYLIWSAFFLAFLTRIPIWPFHSYIASVSSGLKNPLLFIMTNLLPLTGVYGFIRFLPKSFSGSMLYFVVSLEVIALISMLFIALIGFINKEARYKLFSYMSVCYIMYLLSAFSKSPMMMYNVGFSFFAFILITSALSVLLWKINFGAEEYNVSAECYIKHTPRLKFTLGFMVLAAVGMPFSSLFLNNFMIISRLFSGSVYTGAAVLIALLLVYASLLAEFLKLTSDSEIVIEDVEDLRGFNGLFILLMMILLFLSFVRPLWLLEF